MENPHEAKHQAQNENRAQVIITMVLFVSMIVLWGLWVGLDLSASTENVEDMLTAEAVEAEPTALQEDEGEESLSLAEAAKMPPSTFLEESNAALIKDIMATIPGLEKKVKVETYHLHTRYTDLMVMNESPEMREAREAKEARLARLSNEMGDQESEGSTGAPLGNGDSSAQQLKAGLDKGFGLLRSGQPGKALSEFQRAAQAAPGNLTAAVGKAQALYSLNRSEEAMGILEKVVSQRPNHAESLLMLGALSQESGNHRNARKYYKNYLKHHPTGRRSDEIRRVLTRL